MKLTYVLGAAAAVDLPARALIPGSDLNASGGSKDGEGEDGSSSETHIVRSVVS